MALRLTAFFLVAVATCIGQQCPSQPACGCAQPTVIQMTCGGASMPPPPLPPPPPPPPVVSTEPSTEQPTTELIADTDAQPCYNDNLLAIVVDSSGSVNAQNPGNFDLFLGLAAKLAKAWKKNPANGVAMILFNFSFKVIFDLDQGKQMDEATMEQTILSTRYLGGGTATHLGLNAAADELNAHNPNNLPKNVVLITDGPSYEKELTYDAAQKMSASGIKLVAVGVGKAVGGPILMPELEKIVNNPDLVFSAEKFTDLQDLTKKISQALC